MIHVLLLTFWGSTLWPSGRHCPWYQVVGQGRLQLPLPLLRHGGSPAAANLRRTIMRIIKIQRSKDDLRTNQTQLVCSLGIQGFETVKALRSECPVLLRRWTPIRFLLGWMTFWSRSCHFVAWERRTGWNRYLGNARSFLGYPYVETRVVLCFRSYASLTRAFFLHEPQPFACWFSCVFPCFFFLRHSWSTQGTMVLCLNFCAFFCVSWGSEQLTG